MKDTSDRMARPRGYGNVYGGKVQAMLRRSFTAFFVHVLLPVVLCLILAGQAEAVGRFTHVEGRVDVLKEGKAPAVPARVGDPVSLKDVIRTRSDSRAEVVFADGNIVRIAERTRLDISEYAADGGVGRVVLHMPRGRVNAIVEEKVAKRIAASPDANRFEIRTPVAVAGVRGTRFFVTHARGATTVLVDTGAVAVQNPRFPAAVVIVTAGNMSTVAEQQPPTPPRPATETETKGHQGDTAPRDKENAEKDKPADEAPPPPGAGLPDTGAPVPGIGLPPPPSPPLLPPPSPPITETRPQILGGTASPLPPTTNYTGSIEEGKFFFFGPDVTAVGELSAAIRGFSTGATASTGTVSVSSGAFENDFNHKLWGGEFSGTSDRGGAFRGFSGGTWSSSWDGNYAGFYIEGGQIGFLTGNLSGTATAGAFTGGGSLTRTFVAPHSITPATGEALLAALTGNISSTSLSFEDPEWKLAVGEQEVTFGPATTNMEIRMIDPARVGGRGISIWRELVAGTGYANTGLASLSAVFGESYSGSGAFYWAGAGSFTDNLSGKFTVGASGSYIDEGFFGALSVNYTGSYDGGAYRMAGVGTLHLAPLTFVSAIESGMLYRDTLLSLPVEEDLDFIRALMGGTVSLWSGGNIPVTILGSYTAPAETDYNWYWLQGLYPTDFTRGDGETGRHSTYDGGAYYGFLSGIGRPGPAANEGRLYALYIDPDGKAGILRGSFSGPLYPGIQMLEATGTINRIELNSGIALPEGITPSTLPIDWFDDPIYITGFTDPEGVFQESSGGFALGTDDLVTRVNFLSQMTERADGNILRYRFTEDPSFGIWRLESWGKYDPAGTSNKWILERAAYGRVADKTVQIGLFVAWGDTWAGGKLSGTSSLVMADWATGLTWVGAGETIGTYNEFDEPGPAPPVGSFGAVSTGAGTTTTRFLTNPSAFAALGFPTTEVGTPVTLSGSIDIGAHSLSVNVGSDTDKIKFFAYGAGQFPRIWATGSVTGSYTGTVSAVEGPAAVNYTGLSNNPSDLSSATMFGGFNINRWEDNKWIADVFFTGGISGAGGAMQGVFPGVGAGTYDATTLSGTAAGLAFPATYMSRINAPLTRWDGTAKIPGGALFGVTGGVSLWTASGATPDTLAYGGLHSGLNVAWNHTWFQTILPHNFLAGGAPTTTDGGSYWGWLGGSQVRGALAPGGAPGLAGGVIEAMLYALYVDPLGNIGIIRGKNFCNIWLQGWEGELSLYTTQLEPTTGINQAAFTVASIGQSAKFPLATAEPGVFWDADQSGGGISLAASAPRYQEASIAGRPWGIWQMETMGSYVVPTAPFVDTRDVWTISYFLNRGAGSFTGDPKAGLVSVDEITTLGTKWSNLVLDEFGDLENTETLRALHAGYFADISVAPKTGIYVGELKGTFNPTEPTWQAVSMGVRMDTTQFLAMASNDAGRARLQQLNIPAVEVGKVTLAGSGNNMTVSMNNVTFFAPSTGERPSIWATGNVTGTFTAPPTTGTAINLTGGGLNATFTPQTWNTGNGRWLATVSGAGSISGGAANVEDLNFRGAAAGTGATATTGSITGTAAGVAR